MRKVFTTLAAVAAATLLTAGHASAAGTQVYKGTGWQLESSMTASGDGIHSLNKNATYTITFADSAARKTLEYYYKPLADWMTKQTGVKFTVSATNLPEPTACSTAPIHTIVIGLKTRPMKDKGMSHTSPCYDTRDDTAYGAWIDMDKEYWDHPGWFSGTGKNTTLDFAMIWNANAHELGHAIGLDHPNTRDSKGVVKPFDCVKNSAGWRPLMCSPNGGPTNKTGVNYTAYDIAGIKQLVANYTLPAPAKAKPKVKAGQPAGVTALPARVSD
ncbi:hypothetical protein ABZ858_26420 [Streptomyces sp. NPDC047017]|uniref:hypothetical protein n=1 Tax=Streptomyces sp. NPDC047017 TaxID=3155024 RepID=UPI0033CDFD1A